MDAAPGAGRLFARGLATSTGKDAGKGSRAAASPPSFDLFETFGYIEKYPSQGKLSEGWTRTVQHVHDAVTGEPVRRRRAAVEAL